MDIATFLKSTANVVVGVSVVKLLTADLKAEIQKSPYRAAGLAAAAGALTGIALAQRRTACRADSVRDECALTRRGE
jgi:hypothetical protein